jgi:hypothetical protein
MVTKNDNLMQIQKVEWGSDNTPHIKPYEIFQIAGMKNESTFMQLKSCKVNYLEDHLQFSHINVLLKHLTSKTI